jgi:hypothetical protein
VPGPTSACCAAPAAPSALASEKTKLGQKWVSLRLAYARVGRGVLGGGLAYARRGCLGRQKGQTSFLRPWLSKVPVIGVVGLPRVLLCALLLFCHQQRCQLHSELIDAVLDGLALRYLRTPPLQPSPSPTLRCSPQAAQRSGSPYGAQ